MRTRWFAVASVLATLPLLSGGCRDADRAPRQALSWGATVVHVGEAWIAGRVPTAYARRTTRAARERLDAERRSLQGHGAAALAARVDEIARGAGRLDVALAAGDRQAAARAVRDVAAINDALRPPAGQSRP